MFIYVIAGQGDFTGLNIHIQWSTRHITGFDLRRTQHLSCQPSQVVGGNTCYKSAVQSALRYSWPAQKTVRRWTLCQFGLRHRASTSVRWPVFDPRLISSPFVHHCLCTVLRACQLYVGVKLSLIQFEVCSRQSCSLRRLILSVRRPVQKAVCNWTGQFGLPSPPEMQSSLAGLWLPTALFMICICARSIV